MANMAELLQIEDEHARIKRLKRSPESSEAARTSTACNACRYRKIKCSGTRPCRYCSRRQRECVFPETGRKKLYSVAYVEDLERKATFFAEDVTLGEQGSSIDTRGGKSLIDSPGRNDGVRAHEHVLDPESPGTSPLIPDPVMSSSLRFGTHIKGLSTDAVPKRPNPWPAQDVDSPDDAYNIVGQHNVHGSGASVLEYPTEEAAQSLLDTVLGSLGMVQHLLDPRSFSDHLASLSELEPARDQTKDLRDVEILLVFAIGELLQGILGRNSVLPGSRYFQEAVSQLPGFLTLRAAGTVGVEIMGLAAFYLQCADCKEDAYVYAGMALRLAVSNGMANDESSTGLRPSERTHRNRLFWTIYMQERRLAAATGNPFGISDDSIRTSLPAKAPGFQSAGSLNVNIKLARITGQITQVIYGRKDQSEKEFVRHVQEILAALLETQRNIPPEHTVDFSNPSHTFTRTSATLYLMLLQATILATRPFLLHTARSRLQRPGGAESTDTNRPSLQIFCVACIEAAWKTLQILQALRKQQVLAKFGFFDLDALFSAAFVFVLAEKISPRTPTDPSGIRGAASLMGWLSTSGNKAATKRLADIHQMCSHLGIDVDWQGLAVTPTSAAEDVPRESAVPDVQLGGDGEVVSASQPEHAGREAEFDMLSFSPNELDLEAFWNGSNLSLDGTIETDWQEFERITSQF